MGNFKNHYYKAMDEYKEKRYKRVIEEINLYLKEDKKNGIDARGFFVLAKSYKLLEMWRESIRIYKIILKLDPKNVHARLELGKLYEEQGKEKESEKLFEECMELDPKNVHARLELGRLYAGQGKEKEAERLFEECMELDPKNVHARLELGKLYAGQGKEKEAERLFEEYMELDPKNVHARLELGKLYAEQGKENLSKRMYDYILNEIGNKKYDELNRIVHIMKHMRDNKSKRQHGVFIKDPLKILEDMQGQMNEENRRVGYMSDIYLIESKECGYAGGIEGDGHKLNYVTIITLPYSKKIITMFPSDNIFKLEKDFQDSEDVKKVTKSMSEMYRVEIDTKKAKADATKNARKADAPKNIDSK